MRRDRESRRRWKKEVARGKGEAARVFGFG